MSRSVRTFLAIALFLLAALIAVNNIVNQTTSLDNWWLPLLLVIFGLALVLIPEGWSWRGVTRAEEAEADAAIKALQHPAAPALPTTSAEAALAPPAPAETEAAPAPAEAEPETVSEAQAEAEPAPEPEAAPEAAEPEPAPVSEAAVEAEPAPEPEAAPAETEPEPAPEAEPAAPDDLTKIEGIGPKMNAALNAAGITTFARLAQASEEELRAAIEAAGMRFAPSVSTWAEQAAYAARGDWDGLAAFQASLTAGRKE